MQNSAASNTTLFVNSNVIWLLIAPYRRLSHVVRRRTSLFSCSSIVWATSSWLLRTLSSTAVTSTLFYLYERCGMHLCSDVAGLSGSSMVAELYNLGHCVADWPCVRSTEAVTTSTRSSLFLAILP